ncbi:flippase [Flammeovirga sp. SJP92]|uniref:flippase n=1 Tax=Flammeovirga sp. SJP92 TaxID=1775430 RepID=UPI0007898DC7|nr:flippase [Flammeovirga sp. SJP92]KXX67292.1 hypothetical protein AVL50_28315 [Flammeovirga sp. SJP92]
MRKIFEDFNNWRKKEGVVAIFKNLNWLAFDKVSRILVGLFINAWVRRYLGVEDVGLWEYSIALTVMFTSIATFGLERIVIRDLLSTKFKEEDVLGTSFLFRASTSLLSGLGIVAYIYFFSEVESSLLMMLGILGASGLFFQTSDIIQYFYQAHLDVKKTVIVKNISFISFSLFKIFLIYNESSLFFFALVNTLDICIGSIFLLGIYAFETKKIRLWKFNIQYLKELFRDSWPLAVSSLAFIIYSKIDQIMLGDLRESTYDVGIYGTASKLYDIPISVIGIILASIYPPFIELWNRDSKQQFYDRYKKTTLGLTVLAYLGCLFNWFFGEWIILFLFGDAFLPSYHIFSIQCIGAIFLFNASLRSNYLSLSNNQHIIMYSTILGSIINVGLNLYLIPEYGGTGAAYATLITQFFSLYVVNIFFKETRKISLIQVRNLFLIDAYLFLKRKR